MEDWLRMYLEQVEQFPKCDDAWFMDAHHRARRGDRRARELIIGSVLRLVPPVAGQFGGCSRLSLHDPIQEGNVALQGALDDFTGEDSATFSLHVREAVTTHLARLVQQA